MKRILFACACAMGTASVYAEWSDVNGLLKRLDDAQSEWMDADAKFHSDTLARIATLGSHLQQQDEYRSRVYTCITNSISVLQQCLANCLSNKDAVAQQYAREIADLNDQIDAFNRQTQQAIAALQSDIDHEQSLVNDVTTDINTITSLTDENLQKALDQIAQEQSQYDQNATDMRDFISQLNSFFEVAQVYTHNRSSETQTLADLLCQGNDD